MFHTKTIEETVGELSTSLENGLTESEHLLRLKKYGLNELTEPEKKSLILMFLSEFKDFLVLILIAATIISFLLGEHIDAIAILTIVVINALLGFTQEYKAEKALAALKKLSTTFAKVLRNGIVTKIEAGLLVPGDIILVEAGDKIPADARLIETINLEVSEAVLTGESLPILKILEPLSNPNLSIGDKTNLLFKDTLVTSGRGKAVVFATGINTEVGRISTLLKGEIAPQTPLQKELEKVGKNLSIGAILVVILIFLAEIFFDFIPIRLAFLTSVSLAVAAIPEGLPAVITLVLAIGVTRLAKAKAIIRKLPAVETLGATTHILTDKTGTLTQNRMVVTKTFLTNGEEFKIDGEGYIPNGNFYYIGKTLDPTQYKPLQEILRVGILCNDSYLNFTKEKNLWEIVGDITEGALLVCAKKAGFDIEKERKNYERIFEIPFSSEIKYMVTINKIPNSSRLLVCMKGAPEVILKYCSVSENEETKVNEKVNEYSSRSLRSIGFAYKEVEENSLNNENQDRAANNLTFLGIMAQHDPLRPEVKEAVKIAKEAGITTIMVTGDHKLTAIAIARELGLFERENEVISGEELSKLSEKEFNEKVLGIKVFARVSPEQKLKIVKAFRKQKHIVAVTGDGVNDAPAIKAADIGIAMGIEGTDVAREASDMVLQDDNYATIVSAVKEGRIIFDNLIKFITYLISCNISEIFIVFSAVVTKLPLPLLPIHLLWINLITDGFPALALGMEPGEADIMKRAARDTKSGLLNRKRWFVMSIEGLTMGIATYIAFRFSLQTQGIEVARTVTFLSLSFAQLVHSFNSRSETKSLFKIGILENKFLLYVVLVSLMVQIPVLYTKLGDILFQAVPLSTEHLIPVIFVSLTPLVVVEIIKVLRRAKNLGTSQQIKSLCK